MAAATMPMMMTTAPMAAYVAMGALLVGSGACVGDAEADVIG